MLIDFSVKNFRSFNNEQKISFRLEENTRIDEGRRIQFVKNNENYRVLKNAIIYGANASGKSNLFKAVFFLSQLVVISSQPVGIMSDTFANNNDPTKFNITFRKNGDIFKYELEHNKQEIISETLYRNNELIINRKKQDIIFPTVDKTISDRLKDYNPIKNNIPALQFANSFNIKEALGAYIWFNDLITLTLDIQTIKDLIDTPNKKEKLLYAMKFADFNIIDIELDEHIAPVNNFEFTVKNDGSPEVKTLKKDQMVVDIYLKHKDKSGDEYKINLNSESDGTRKFLTIVSLVLSNQTDDVAILFDEFDISLHKQLTKGLIKLLNSENNKIQFIASSHNEDLMDELDPKQIYFIEKTDGESNVYKMSDFGPSQKRTGVSKSKKYDDGIYGATQIINEAGLIGLLEDA